MTRRGVIALLASGAASSLGACTPNKKRLRYRLTIEVDTPMGPRTGSSVQEMIHIGKTPWLPGGDVLTTEMRGDAVAIDLFGKVLFLLIRPTPDFMLSKALLYGVVTPRIDVAEATRWYQDRAPLLDRLNRVRPTVRLPLAALPSASDIDSLHFVIFRDLDNPLSIKRVDPLHLPDDFARGSAVNAIKFEFVTEDISRDINKYFSWFADRGDFRAPRDSGFANTLPPDLNGLRS